MVRAINKAIAIDNIKEDNNLHLIYLISVNDIPLKKKKAENKFPYLGRLPLKLSSLV